MRYICITDMDNITDMDSQTNQMEYGIEISKEEFLTISSKAMLDKLMPYAVKKEDNLIFNLTPDNFVEINKQICEATDVNVSSRMVLLISFLGMVESAGLGITDFDTNKSKRQGQGQLPSYFVELIEKVKKNPSLINKKGFIKLTYDQGKIVCDDLASPHIEKEAKKSDSFLIAAANFKEMLRSKSKSKRLLLSNNNNNVTKDVELYEIQYEAKDSDMLAIRFKDSSFFNDVLGKLKHTSDAHKIMIMNKPSRMEVAGEILIIQRMIAGINDVKNITRLQCDIEAVLTKGPSPFPH